MGTTDISIKDEVYEFLLALKGGDESLSDLLERLTKDKFVMLEEFYGIMKDEKETLDKMLMEVEGIRNP